MAAQATGELTLPGFDLMPERYEAVKWFPRGWEWVDPQKEVAAYKDAVRCGFKTQADVVSAGGGDLEELLIARASEVKRAEQLGLQLDTNPFDDKQGGSPGSSPAQT
jgi:capsid protein